jgi:hypothetical protein
VHGHVQARTLQSDLRSSGLLLSQGMCTYEVRCREDGAVGRRAARPKQNDARAGRAQARTRTRARNSAPVLAVPGATSTHAQGRRPGPGLLSALPLTTYDMAPASARVPSRDGRARDDTALPSSSCCDGEFLASFFIDLVNRCRLYQVTSDQCLFITNNSYSTAVAEERRSPMCQ